MVLSICFRFMAGEVPAVVVNVRGDVTGAAWEEAPG